jgi:hypothetical protein
MASYYQNWSVKDLLSLLDRSKSKVIDPEVEQICKDLTLIKLKDPNWPAAIVDLQDSLHREIVYKLKENL